MVAYMWISLDSERLEAPPYWASTISAPVRNYGISTHENRCLCGQNCRRLLLFTTVAVDGGSCEYVHLKGFPRASFCRQISHIRPPRIHTSYICQTQLILPHSVRTMCEQICSFAKSKVGCPLCGYNIIYVVYH